MHDSLLSRAMLRMISTAQSNTTSGPAQTMETDDWTKPFMIRKEKVEFTFFSVLTEVVISVEWLKWCLKGGLHLKPPKFDYIFELS